MREVVIQLSSILAAKGHAVRTIDPQATVNALVQALAEHRVGALVVSTDGRGVAGIVSERDVVRALVDGTAALQRPVSAIMTTDVHCARPDTTIDELAVLMTDQRIRHVPVLDDDGALAGLVSIGDVVKFRLGELEGERQALLGYITQG